MQQVETQKSCPRCLTTRIQFDEHKPSIVYCVGCGLSLPLRDNETPLTAWESMGKMLQPVAPQDSDLGAQYLVVNGDKARCGVFLGYTSDRRRVMFQDPVNYIQFDVDLETSLEAKFLQTFPPTSTSPGVGEAGESSFRNCLYCSSLPELKIAKDGEWVVRCSGKKCGFERPHFANANLARTDWNIYMDGERARREAKEKENQSE